MISCQKHGWLDTSPVVGAECPTCAMERTLAGLPPGRKPIEIISTLETCLGFLEWLVKHPMDFAAVVVGELNARELVARYVKGMP